MPNLLQGNREGLSPSVAPKMVTCIAKMSPHLEAKDSVLLAKLMELNKKYGSDIPLKQTSFLETKPFWDLADHPDVQVSCIDEAIKTATSSAKGLTAKCKLNS